MPKYDYHCSVNGEVVEVFHKMSETITTWAELCEKAALDLGQTPGDSPVRKVIGAPAVNTPKIGEWKINPAKKKRAAQHNHGSGGGCC